MWEKIFDHRENVSGLWLCAGQGGGVLAETRRRADGLWRRRRKLCFVRDGRRIARHGRTERREFFGGTHDVYYWPIQRIARRFANFEDRVAPERGDFSCHLLFLKLNNMAGERDRRDYERFGRCL